MMGHTAAVLFALATMANAGDQEVASFYHGDLVAGQKFQIETADRLFRGALVNVGTGECQLSSSTDGASFSAPRTAYLLGATAGQQQGQMLVLMHEVKVGLKMELGLGDLEQKNRLVTSEVKAIRLIP